MVSFYEKSITQGLKNPDAYKQGNLDNLFLGNRVKDFKYWEQADDSSKNIEKEIKSSREKVIEIKDLKLKAPEKTSE